MELGWSKALDMDQILKKSLLGFIAFTTRERDTLLFIWTWTIYRQGVGHHKNPYQEQPGQLEASFREIS